jgi:hypothetical protein
MVNYEIRTDGVNYQVIVTSPMSRGGEVFMTEDQYHRFRAWLNGSKMIQDALPDLSKDEREILMTGIGPEEWNEMFKEER